MPKLSTMHLFLFTVTDTGTQFVLKRVDMQQTWNSG